MAERFHLKLSKERAQCLINCLVDALKTSSCESVTITEIQDDSGNFLAIASSPPVIRMLIQEKVKKPMPKPNTIAVGRKD